MRPTGEAWRGITGWAQISCAYGSSLDDVRLKLGYDPYYLKNCSLSLGLLIMVRTIGTVMRDAGGGASLKPAIPRSRPADWSGQRGRSRKAPAVPGAPVEASGELGGVIKICTRAREAPDAPCWDTNGQVRQTLL